MTLRQCFSLWYFCFGGKNYDDFSYFFIQLRSSWVDSLLYLVKVRFIFSAWALQQFNKNCRCVVTVSAWTIKKLSVIKSDIRICVENLPRIIFIFELVHCSFGILLVFCLCVLKQLLISRPLQPGFVLVFTLQCEVRVCWMKAWMSSCSFDHSYSAAGATLPPVINNSFDDSSSILC